RRALRRVTPGQGRRGELEEEEAVLEFERRHALVRADRRSVAKEIVVGLRRAQIEAAALGATVAELLRAAAIFEDGLLDQLIGAAEGLAGSALALGGTGVAIAG